MAESGYDRVPREKGNNSDVVLVSRTGHLTPGDSSVVPPGICLDNGLYHDGDSQYLAEGCCNCSFDLLIRGCAPPLTMDTNLGMPDLDHPSSVLAAHDAETGQERLDVQADEDRAVREPRRGVKGHNRKPFLTKTTTRLKDGFNLLVG